MRLATIAIIAGISIFSFGLVSYTMERANEERLYSSEKMRDFTRNNFQGLHGATVECAEPAKDAAMVLCAARGKVYDRGDRTDPSLGGGADITIYARCPKDEKSLNMHQKNECEHALHPKQHENQRGYM